MQTNLNPLNLDKIFSNMFTKEFNHGILRVESAEDLCDICHKPNFMEHTDCLKKITGYTEEEASEDFKDDTMYVYTAKIPVQYYDQFENKLFYEANSPALQQIKLYMQNDWNFSDLDGPTCEWLKSASIFVNIQEPHYWFIKATITKGILNEKDKRKLHQHLRDGFMSTAAMFTTEFNGEMEYVSFEIMNDNA